MNMTIDGATGQLFARRVIAQHASSLLIEMELDLRRIKPRSHVVFSSADLERFFPAGIIHSTGKGDKVDANFIPKLPLDPNNDNAAALVQEYIELINYLRGHAGWDLTDRFSKNPTKRFLTMINRDIPAELKSIRRDFGRLILSAMLECRLSRTYRPELLKGAAGILRENLVKAILPFSRKTNVINPKTGNYQPVTRWEYPDLIDNATSSTYKPKAAAQQWSLLEAGNERIRDQEAIQKFIKAVEKMPQALSRRPLSAKDKPPVAKGVNNLLKALVKVNW
jgi:hypothetical protein